MTRKFNASTFCNAVISDADRNVITKAGIGVYGTRAKDGRKR